MSDLTIVVAKAVCKAAGYDPVGFNADTLPENESHDGWQNWMGFQDEARAAIKGYLSAAKAGDRAAFQARVQPWMMACFGAEISADGVERNHRFLEEALELVQALGCTQNEAHQLVDYVYGRDVGDPKQEVGGVMVTLAALCLAHGLDMHACGETELARIWTKVEAIRVKQAAKPKHSPLPMHVPGKAGERADGANLQDLFAGWKLVPVEPTEAMKKQAAPFFSSWCELECSAEDAAENVWDEMISAAPKAPIAEGWRPIETAPKDGTEILLWLPIFNDPAKGYCAAVGAFICGDWRADDDVDSNLNCPVKWRALPEGPADFPACVAEIEKGARDA